MMFGFSDRELATKSGYDLIHPDDLSYFAAAHQECKYLPPLLSHFEVFAAIEGTYVAKEICCCGQS